MHNENRETVKAAGIVPAGLRLQYAAPQIETYRVELEGAIAATSSSSAKVKDITYEDYKDEGNTNIGDITLM